MCSPYLQLKGFEDLSIELLTRGKKKIYFRQKYILNIIELLQIQRQICRRELLLRQNRPVVCDQQQQFELLILTAGGPGVWSSHRWNCLTKYRSAVLADGRRLTFLLRAAWVRCQFRKGRLKLNKDFGEIVWEEMNFGYYVKWTNLPMIQAEKW